MIKLSTKEASRVGLREITHDPNDLINAGMNDVIVGWRVWDEYVRSYMDVVPGWRGLPDTVEYTDDGMDANIYTEKGVQHLVDVARREGLRVDDIKLIPVML